MRAILTSYGLFQHSWRGPASSKLPLRPIRKLYVDNTAADTVSVVDLATRKVVQEIPVGMHPHGLGFPQIGVASM